MLNKERDFDYTLEGIQHRLPLSLKASHGEAVTGTIRFTELNKDFFINLPDVQLPLPIGSMKDRLQLVASSIIQKEPNI